MKPLFIFDLDGTLALNEHRHHLVPQCWHGTDTPLPGHSWEPFSLACIDDEPYKAVIDTLETLILGGAEVRIWTSRDGSAILQTKAWLAEHVPSWGLGNIHLLMRYPGDHTPDTELKLTWFKNLSAEEKKRFVCVFEDRNRMVEAWRKNGVPCFQVALGPF